MVSPAEAMPRHHNQFITAISFPFPVSKNVSTLSQNIYIYIFKKII